MSNKRKSARRYWWVWPQHLHEGSLILLADTIKAREGMVRVEVRLAPKPKAIAKEIKP